MLNDRLNNDFLLRFGGNFCRMDLGESLLFDYCPRPIELKLEKLQVKIYNVNKLSEVGFLVCGYDEEVNVGEKTYVLVAIGLDELFVSPLSGHVSYSSLFINIYFQSYCLIGGCSHDTSSFFDMYTCIMIQLISHIEIISMSNPL